MAKGPSALPIRLMAARYPTRLARLARRIAGSLLLLLQVSCASWWEVRPYPAFVQAELQPGDRIRIQTHDGQRRELTVVAPRSDRIVGESETVLLEDIRLLEKRGESPPANPCSPQVPLGCSVPELAKALHESQSHYSDYFYPACEQHDYCYRHGEATYGKNRAACDGEFLLDMKALCRPDTMLEWMIEAGGKYAECSLVAIEFHQAVQRYGADRFRSGTDSTYCEYDGPPPGTP
jgi:hypothetical protein